MTGYALCGSFCTHAAALDNMRALREAGVELLPILSENSYTMSTRFGSAEALIDDTEKLCGRKALHTIAQSESIGPADGIDALIIAPCTGNTLAKLAHGITDTAVTMAAKAALRNRRPVIIGLCTNDGLSANGPNIGLLLNRKNVYFVPFYQDDGEKKPSSVVCDMALVYKTYLLALEGKQIQPIFF